MRPIISEEDETKKRKRRNLILGVFLIFIMLFSTIGYSFMGEEDSTNQNKISYNGYEFVKNENFWFLNVNNKQFVFRNNPFEAETINQAYEIDSVNKYIGIPLYVYSDDEEAGAEIFLNLAQFTERTQFACLENETCNKENLPIKTCDDNFISIKYTNQTSIYKEKNCLFIEGPVENITKITDGVIFKILGIN